MPSGLSKSPIRPQAPRVLIDVSRDTVVRMPYRLPFCYCPRPCRQKKIYIYIFAYLRTWTERERERYIYIYIYLAMYIFYIYIYIEMKTATHKADMLIESINTSLVFIRYSSR